MARPKRNQDGPSARERIQEAFWALMDEMPYDAITVTTLAKRAGVNHNTIYYYYENIDHLAFQLLEENIPENIGQILGDILTRGQAYLYSYMSEPDLFLRWRRMCLFLQSESSYLVEYVKKKMIRTWCETMQTSPEALTRDQRVSLEFILAGMMVVLKLAFQEKDMSILSSLLESPLGQGLWATLSSLGQDTSA